MTNPHLPEDSDPSPGMDPSSAPVCMPDGSTIEAITAFDVPSSDSTAGRVRWYLVIYQPRGAWG